MRFHRGAALLLGVLTTTAAVSPAHATSDVRSVRLSGASRYETAAAIARASFSTVFDAVLVRGDTFADALPAAFLAGAFNGGGPILLTPPSELHPATGAALAELGVQRVFILGDPAAISSDVEDELERRGYATHRFGGATRYDTAEIVAASADDQIGQIPERGPTALVVNGESFPDALTVGPLAHAMSLPIVLTKADTLVPQAARALQQRRITHVVIVGGSHAVSAAVEREIRRNYTVERLFGDDRSGTAAAVLRFMQTRLGWSISGVLLARGDTFPDALAAAALGGEARTPIVLARDPSSLGAPTHDVIREHRQTISIVTALGDATAISNGVLAEAHQAATSSSSTSEVEHPIAPSR